MVRIERFVGYGGIERERERAMGYENRMRDRTFKRPGTIVLTLVPISKN